MITSLSELYFRFKSFITKKVTSINYAVVKVARNHGDA